MRRTQSISRHTWVNMLRPLPHPLFTQLVCLVRGQIDEDHSPHRTHPKKSIAVKPIYPFYHKMFGSLTSKKRASENRVFCLKKKQRSGRRLCWFTLKILLNIIRQTFQCLGQVVRCFICPQFLSTHLTTMGPTLTKKIIIHFFDGVNIYVWMFCVKLSVRRLY